MIILALARKKYCLKSSNIPFRESVFRTFDQHVPSAFKRKQLLINFVSMRAVRKKFSRNRGSRGFINFVYGYKEPFAMESFFDYFYLFTFHNSHHNKKGIIFFGERQGEYLCKE